MIILPDSYTKLRRLSAHQRHETWLCRCANGGKAVLKLSTSEESPGIRQEIAVHRKVKHPSLVGPTEEGKHFVAYPFLEGKTLAEMTVGESLGYADTVDLGLQILDVLVQVHQHGFLHKDINPSNLLFSDGRWFLLDFEIGYAQTAFLGSLPFAPPEHRGLLVREPGPWSDLYSLGKVLGFCLNPTKAVADALSLEDRHLAGTPLSLKEFLKRLTAKDAEARYRTSEGALHDLNLIRSKPHSLHVLGLKDNGARLSPQTFVGREDVLARVREAARRTAEGDFRSIWIEARPGYGKTHLLDVLTEQLAGPEVVILTARGSAERTLSPIEQWERQLSEVSSYDEPGVRPAPGAGILAHQLYFCQRLNSVDAPKVLFCDDAQWMENECRSFLSLAQERCGRLLVGVFSRPTEGTHDLMLQPLSRSKSRALLRSLTGGLPKKIEDQILEAAQGSPFLLEGYVRGLAESGQIFQSDNQWMAAEEASLSLGKKEAYTVGRRLDDLPSESRRLLLFLAVLGTSPLSGLQDFAPQAEGLELLESRHLVTRSANALSVKITHDLIKEAALQQSDAEEKRALHSYVAEITVDTLEKARHLLAAEKFEQARRLALKAGREATSRDELMRSLEAYQIAHLAADSSGHACSDKFIIHKELTRVCEALNRLEESEYHFSRALPLVTSPVEEAELRLAQAWMEFKSQNKQASALTRISEVLAKMEEPVPSNSAVLLFKTLNEIIRYFLWTKFSRRLVDRSFSAISGTKVKAYYLASLTAAHSLRPLVALWFTFRGANLGVSLGTRELALCNICNSIALLSSIPFVGATASLMELLSDQMEHFEGKSVRGVIVTRLGYAAAALERYEQALRQITDGVRQWERFGDRWELDTANMFVSFINGIQGNREDARRFGLSALRGALTGQDSLNYWCALEGLAYSGLFPLESGQQELECHTPNSKGARETYLGLRFQSQGDYLSAFRHHSRLFETAAPPSWRNGLKLPSAITSLRRLLLHLPPYAERLRRDMLSCFRKKLTECKRHVKRFPIARSHVLRENAWLLRFEGQGECCLQRVSQASETAAQKGLRMEELHSYQEELELRRSLNLDAVQTRRKVGDLKRQIFGETDGTEGLRYLQNLETFKQLLEVAPQLSLALSSAELVERALECAKELFNQAQCAVLHRDGSVLASNQDCTYLPSETLLRQVVQTGQPQLSSNLPSSSASLTLHGVDSRILAPVFAGNKVTYLIWVCQFEVPDMYDEEDIKLIKYLSRLMGITLDSLQLLEEESSVTRALEEEAARNRKLFEHSPIAHAVFSVHSEPLQGNQAWDQLAPSSEEYQTRTFTTHLSDGRHLVSCYPQELEDESPLIKRQHEQLDSLQQILKKDALEPLGELLSKIQDADLEDVASLTGQTRELVDSLGTVISELRDEHVLA